MSIRIGIAAAAVCGPGLQDWPHARAILRGEMAYVLQPMRNPAPSILPPGERRRTSLAVRLAIELGLQATAAAAVDPAALAAVFGSSDGDGETIHSVCAAIAQPGYPVSPTRFHNSVHNAPAGYWSIAVGSQHPSTSLCAYDDTCAVALLDAATQVAVERKSVLLVVSDVAAPPPLNRTPPVEHSFGSAFVLCSEGTRLQTHVRTLELRLLDGSPSPAVEWPDSLPCELALNPAARMMPLLHALSMDHASRVRLPYGPDAQLQLELGA